MKGIVIYDTSYGNTRTVGETIAETLKQSGIEVDVFYVKDVKKLNANDYDFMIPGSPTRFGTMSLTVKSFLGRVKSKQWINKHFAAFGTENPENIERGEGSAAEKIAGQLKEKQMIELLPPLRAIALGWKGPLKQGEIERTQEYARELALKLKQE
jgi:menaquinone-dependent protoporphyrinogen IX oxidase